MKILVISDTHGQVYRAQQLIDLYKNEGVTHLVHCGDVISDAKSLKESNPHLTVYKVPGNCDFVSSGVDSSLFVDLGGVPTLIMHGHQCHVNNGYEELYIDAEAHGAKLVMFGHTHSAHKEEKSGIKVLNPGSLTQPRDTNYPSFALVTIENGYVKKIEIKQMQGVNHIGAHPFY